MTVDGMHWDTEADVVVLGTGAGGLVAALAARQRGRSVALLEKSSRVGGTAAITGGVIWFPGNHRQLAAGLSDDPEQAIGYVKAIADGRSDPQLIETYVRRGPDMVQWVEANTTLEFTCMPTYPDYHPEMNGAAAGRSLDAGLFDTTLLGAWQPKLRKNKVNGRAPITIPEAIEWGVFYDPMGFDYAKVKKRAVAGIVHGGASLVGKLLLACLESGVEPSLETAGQDLITDDTGRVIGVEATSASGTIRVRATHGVVLATGGFEWNPELRSAFLPLGIERPVSPPHNTGDGLRMAMKVGAELGNMPEAWWTPCVALTNEEYDGAPLYRPEFFARCLPHSIIVNDRGRRFTNEAANYNDMTKPWFTHDPSRYRLANVPAWLIVDAQYMSKYPLVTSIPGRPAPAYLQQAPTLEQLAEVLGIDSEGLLDTVARFNGFVADGVDKDYLRGASRYDRFFGDPRAKKNPNLGTVEQGPFYAIEIHAGAMGTKGGPKTNVDGQVLRAGGGVVEGLYAAGNVAAGLGGAGYAGAGITIGTSMFMGWQSARHACDTPGA